MERLFATANEKHRGDYKDSHSDFSDQKHGKPGAQRMEPYRWAGEVLFNAGVSFVKMRTECESPKFTCR